MMLKIAKSIIVLLLLVPFLYAQNDGFQKYTDTTGTLSVEIPAMWQELALNDVAEIQVGYEIAEQYFMVLHEKKTDLYGWNLQKHSYVTLGNLVGSLTEPTISGPRKLEVNGHDALQYEIEGVTDGLIIVYLHTTIETDKSFNQVLAWSLKSKIGKAKKIFEHVIGSFKEE